MTQKMKESNDLAYLRCKYDLFTQLTSNKGHKALLAMHITLTNKENK